MRILAVLLLFSVSAARAAPQDSAPLIDQAFRRMYAFDFLGAHAILDKSGRQDPGNPLNYSVRAAVYLFSELDRLRILQTDFFVDDDKLIDKKKLQPDPVLRVDLFRAVGQARRIANARLALKPDDRDALFAMCMSSSIVTDYTALVERKQWRSLSMAKQTNLYAQKLLALDPPFYDAHLAVGVTEYVIGSLPFFLRWLVRIDQIQGSKERSFEILGLVALHGKYYAPYAKILLAVGYLREKRPRDAQRYLAEFASEYPENQLVRRELERVNGMLRKGR